MVDTKHGQELAGLLGFAFGLGELTSMHECMRERPTSTAHVARDCGGFDQLLGHGDSLVMGAPMAAQEYSRDLSQPRDWTDFLGRIGDLLEDTLGFSTGSQPPQVARQDDRPSCHGTAMIERTCQRRRLLNMREAQEWIFTDIPILHCLGPQHPGQSEWLALLECIADCMSAPHEMARCFELTEKIEQI
jgi:hypothetical protein